MTNEISNYDDIIDVRDVIARVEELREERDTFVVGSPDGNEAEAPEQWAAENPEDAAELETLEDLLASLCGKGGDEQWEGDWYPVIMVRDSYFEDYAQDLAEDCGFTSGNEWPARCIDWGQAALELQMDYSFVEFNGVTYWYR